MPDEPIAIRAYHFSIVAVGAMNPRLHHPGWYRLIGAISEEEESAALASPSLVVIPPLARLEVGGITISCQENRWEIICTQTQHRERIKAIAGLVFEKLFETPLQLYGLNNNFEIETAIKDLRRSLAGVVTAMDVGLKAQGEASSSIIFTDQYAQKRQRVVVAPSQLSADVLSFAQNSEYRITDEIGTERGYFEFGKLLEKHFDADYRDAMTLATDVVKKLNSRFGAN